LSDHLPRVFLGIPNTTGVVGGVLTATHTAGTGHKLTDIACLSRSLLTQNFNALFAAALNDRPRVEWFCMMHSDLFPPGWGWLDKLLEEARQNKAQVVSVVNAIKNETGITSTAILNPATRELRRLTLREIHKLPVSFDAEQAGFPGQILCINTGLWIADIRGDWADRWIAEGGCFRNRDRIVRAPNGQYAAQSFSEDWVFGCDLHRMGVRAIATRAVRTVHRGDYDFANDAPWGTWSKDEAVPVAFEDQSPSGEMWPKPSHEPSRGKIDVIRSRTPRPVDQCEAAVAAS
jgi:hypothetical protein